MTPADRHPPEHVLAELAEDVRESGSDLSVPPGVDQSGAREHVRGCEACQAMLRQLDQTSQMLRELPTRLPTPEHVSARIGAALAAEAAQLTSGDAVEAGPSVGAPATVTSLQDRPVAWFRRRAPQLLSAAAAAALVGVVGYSFLDGQSGDDMTTVQGESAQDDAAADEGAGDGGLDMAESRNSAPGAAAEEEAAPGAADDSEELATDGDDGELSDNVLSDTLTEVWAARDEVQPGCGQALADDVGSTLVGSDDVGDQLVIVLADGEQLTGWLVPDCDATSDAGQAALTIPAPSE